MIIDLESFEYFTFSWYNTTLEKIKKYLLENNSLKFNVTKNFKQSKVISFKYNPKTFIANFMELNGGVLMLPNLMDGWITLFNNIMANLKISGYYFVISSEKIKEPYNCMIYMENEIKKRICYTLKDNNKWMFYENGEPLFFENKKNYKNKLKKDKMNKDILINYCNELKIITGHELKIENAQNNIRIEYKNV